VKPAIWILSALMMTAQNAPPQAGLLPANAGGWTAVPPDKVFEGEGIFEYIDGAGEVYRAYNYRSVVSRRYEKEGAPDLIVDLFDMGSARDAFGVFTHDLEGERWPVGQDGLYKSGLLQFWRDRYFVAVSADAETAESKAAVAELGAKIASAVGRDGERPELLSRLPEDFKGGATVRYLHSPVILNYHFFVSRENILRLDARTEAVLAAEGEKGGKRILLLVRYPSAGEAEKAFGSFLEAYMPEARPSGVSAAPRVVKTEDGFWTAAGRRDVYLALIFNAATEGEAGGSLAAALAKLEST